MKEYIRIALYLFANILIFGAQCAASQDDFQYSAVPYSPSFSSYSATRDPSFSSHSATREWIDGTHDLIARAHQLVHVSYSATRDPSFSSYSATREGRGAPGRIGAALAPQRPKVGDERKFHAVDFSRSGTPYFANATCRAVGEFCYIFVEDSQWNRGTVTNTDVVKLRRAFDNSTPGDPARGIYELETKELGPPPEEIDLDPKIYILILDIPDNYNSFGTYVAGYFEPVNQKRGVFRDPRTGMKLYSNEVEMLYIDSDPLDVSSDMSKEILAHEFQHLIHWRHDPDEDLWVNEGCSEYAALFLCGYETGNSWHLEAFEREPEISLVYWPAGIQSSLANYGAAYLWMVYLHEHYGGAPIISSLITEPDNGIKGVNDVLSARGYTQDFADVFSDWKIANLLDNTSFASGRYGYRSLDLRIKSTSRHSTLPILNFSHYTRSWAANYIEFSGANEGIDLQVDFAARNPNHSFDVRAIVMKNGAPVAVESVDFSGEGTGHISIQEFGYAVDKVILVSNWKPGKADFGGSAAYSYSARLGEDIALDVMVLPNAVHERYVDFIVQFNQEIGTGVPRITITKPGKIIASEQSMVRVPQAGNRDKDVYVHQFYVPDGWNSSEIRWNISYLGRAIDAGNLGTVLPGMSGISR